MNMRPLSPVESQNLAALNSSGCNSVLLYLTDTGLGKGIIDATEPMRRMLLREGIHDFSTQRQGRKEHGATKPAIVLGSLSNVGIEVSLYRPKTKSHRGGDPRFWFSRFKRFAKGGDVCAVFVHSGTIHVLNLTSSTVAADLRLGINSSAAQFIYALSRSNGSIAIELLDNLKALANSPIRAVCKGDTAIGRSIEHALGIRMNSSKKPDYKGIELKSSRSRKNRGGLFSCVPDWRLSQLKSSLELLDRFGYRDSKGIFAFRCTVSANAYNPNGLILKLDEPSDLLHELFKASPPEQICAWKLSHLHKRLAEKHNETFWIHADSTKIKGVEHFFLKSAFHTSKPSFEQFDRLLGDGSITVDHMSEEYLTRGKTGNTRTCYEKGPAFKIKPNRRKELFLGAPKLHPLC